MDFRDPVVLITGASSGIGRCLAVELAARGALVVGCGRSLEQLQTLSTELQGRSPLSTAIQCDVAQLDQVRAMVTNVLSEFGKIGILINNAGVGMRKPFIEDAHRCHRRNNTNQLLRYGLLYPRSSALDDRGAQRAHREYLLCGRKD